MNISLRRSLGAEVRTGYKRQTAAPDYASKHAGLKQFFSRPAAKPPAEKPAV